MIEEGARPQVSGADRRLRAARLLGDAAGPGARPPRPIMAAADTLTVTIRGRGGHGSPPHPALDPVPVACEAVLALQTMVTRRFSAFDPVVTTGLLPGRDHQQRHPGRRLLRGHRPLLLPGGAGGGAGGLAAGGPRHRRSARPGGRRRVRRHVPGDRQRPGRGRLRRGDGQGLLGEDRWTTMPTRWPGPRTSPTSPSGSRPPRFLGACADGLDPETAPYNHSPEAAFADSVLADGAALLAALAAGRLSRG